MATRTVTQHFCDWCGDEMPDPGTTTAFAGKVSHWENGPDKWDEELCAICDRKFKDLRKARLALSDEVTR